jgi:predicted TIM-barrel fold metal-dependent hydrolase
LLWNAIADLAWEMRSEPLNLIDTHQHLIHRSLFRYSWTKAVPALSIGEFTLETYRKLSAGTISKSIFMETGVDDPDYQNEARFVAQLIENQICGLVGQIASCRPELDEGFEAWLEDSGSLTVLGYRRILHTEPDEISRTTTFRRNLRKIGARKKTFDMCFQARQLPLAYELAGACSNMTLVLDHCGVPNIADGEFAQWAKEMKSLSRLEHVVCKLSGLLAYCAPGTANLTTIRPYIEHVLECFGPSRIMWGSDWPVVNLGGGLLDWLNITQEVFNLLSKDEAAMIAHQTAEKVYGI